MIIRENEPKIADILEERDPHLNLAMTEWGKALREKEPNQLQLDDRADKERITRLILDRHPTVEELKLPHPTYSPSCTPAHNRARKPYKRKTRQT